MNSIYSIIVLLILLLLSLRLACFIAKIIRWKMYIWLPDYLLQIVKRPEIPRGIRHIIFLTVDHYEPGFGEKGAEINSKWLEDYCKLADLHRDSYGRVPQHTWFYAYDHKNERVMNKLSSMVRAGYGEIEFHWHHKNDTNETFSAKLAEGITWFNSYGAMSDSKGRIAFAFIHGDWSLDNARGREFCGVSRELDILKSHGCYADFTFPAFGTVAQPRKVNAIYYAKDDDKSKSYTSGCDAKVGQRNDQDLMIFEGPLTLSDYGAIELDPYPDANKIDSWITANIHVKGRPEWLFVKTYTHGVQSSAIFFSSVIEKMFSYLEERYGTGSYRLHYVTAREAYNIVRAAEDGMTGDPDIYRDYDILPPINKYK